MPALTMTTPLIPFDIDDLPRPGNPDRAAAGLDRWREQGMEEHAGFHEALAADPAGRALLDAVFGNSPFLSRCFLQYPDFVREVLTAGPQDTLRLALESLKESLARETSFGKVEAELRHAKRKAALAIGLADIAGLWPLDQVTRALTAVAEATLGICARYVLGQAAANDAISLADEADPEHDSGYIVLGMGKLGAHELNYSSDIDLIVLYDAERVRGADPETLGKTFVRATRQLVHLMDARTADGYVFRTDLRLRPDPGATPLAISVEAAEAYYESVGQNWERAAMIKARPVAGDIAAGEEFLRHLNPYIWRRYLDFATIQDVHSIKRQITAYRGGDKITVNGHNIKLGRGGIREIEFFCQTQQLIWGGRNPQLRSRETVTTLEALTAEGRIEPETAWELTEAYRFLRTLEHRLQMVDDKQTHDMPGEDDGVARIAAFMGYAGDAGLRADLLHHLGRVEHHYARLFEESPDLGAEGALVFTGAENHPDTVATLEGMGFADGGSVSNIVRNWHHGRYRATRNERARQILTELMPRLLKAFAGTANPDTAFARFDEFIAGLPAGVQLFSLFHANP
ncbi:MAG: glutamine-synthetase adenylyltransferase, partial [Alphaproteobacteria bacterium]